MSALSTPKNISSCTYWQLGDHEQGDDEILLAFWFVRRLWCGPSTLHWGSGLSRQPQDLLDDYTTEPNTPMLKLSNQRLNR